MTHQPPPRSDGTLPVTITYLEIAPKDWTRRGQPPRIAIEIVRVPRPTAAVYFDLYDRVGRDWLWYERRLLGEAALTALLNRPGHEVHVALHDGALVGYFELYDDEIVFFGLTPEYIGQRIGPWLLDRAIERGFTRGAATLVLNTNTVDHPRALDTYRKAGFRIVRREETELQDPRVLWPDIYRWPPK
ncbi:MAG: GNAT family N-acetyltransferase [Reyranella sp.]|uniref:GNAT family N-acetyltransferase n=1 Tax=Reyranella sp. TaxID=1929291 RepID=UPI001ACC1636|nr:GNAT family N-acetyltransferase [Reyranella sp.]MBN9088448.1 GNAT family N-acetyltransferase [Reyranella sp.]